MNVETFRQVPVDIEIEQAVLGAVLIDNRRLEPLTVVLKEEEFYDPLHQRIYATMLKVWEQGRAITPLTLKALMQNDPGLAEIGQDYFVSLAEAAPAIANVRELARIIHDSAVRRELHRIGEDLVNNALDVDVDKRPRSSSRPRRRRSTASRRTPNTAKARSISPRACAARSRTPSARRPAADASPA